MKLALILGLGLLSATAAAQTLNCNLQDYKSVDGLKAVADGQAVTLTWDGEGGQQLRARFTLRDSQPVIAELAARRHGGPWIVLGSDLAPQFEVTTGKRRISVTEMDILKKQHADTPENIEQYKWTVFWDAPLSVPGHSTWPGRRAHPMRWREPR
jgi:hypothetical protein